jgi:hypothetical protein
MKKIVISAMTIVIGLAVNAASCDWAAVGLAGFNGEADAITGDNVYAFESTVVGQQALLSAFLAGGETFSTTLAKGYLGEYDSGESAGSLGNIYGNAAATSVYLAVVDGDNLFISSISEGVTGAAGQAGMAEFDLSEDIGNKFAAGTETYGGAGWYSAAAIPEPTSGLLLLLGVAGLALKRKRA